VKFVNVDTTKEYIDQKAEILHQKKLQFNEMKHQMELQLNESKRQRTKEAEKEVQFCRAYKDIKKVAEEMNDAISNSNMLYLRAMGLAPLEAVKPSPKKSVTELNTERLIAKNNLQ
jgi:hypothetical protein